MNIRGRSCQIDDTRVKNKYEAYGADERVLSGYENDWVAEIQGLDSCQSGGGSDLMMNFRG